MISARRAESPAPKGWRVGRSALGTTLDSLRSVGANPHLRRIQLALVASLIGDGAYLTAVTVWAYGQGGARAVGLFTAARMVAAAVLAPVGAAIAERCSRRMALLVADGVRAVLVALAALALSAGSPWWVYGLATAAGVLNAPFRSVQRAWMPDLVNSPSELTASNAASSTVESLAVFVAPALGGLLLVVADVRTVFWLNVATFLVSMALVLGVRVVRTTRETAPPAERVGALGELSAGFRLLLGDADLRVITGQVCAQTFVSGAARVFLVVMAIDVLGTGANGVGLLDAVIGVGAVLGGVLALARAARQQLGRDLGLGIVLWSAPLGLIALLPHPVVVVIALIVLGVANPLVDVNLDTLVQRMSAPGVMARVFGALDTFYIATSALGSLVAPALLVTVGLRWTLVVIGAPVLVVAVASRTRMVRLDERLVAPTALPLLRATPLFAPLGPAVLETVARELRTVSVVAGTVVVSQGDHGDSFFLIQEGRVEVTQDGRLLREECPGEFFGEIALLHDVPRTATVTATTDAVLLVLDRDRFLEAMTGEGLRAARSVASTRLSHRA